MLYEEFRGDPGNVNYKVWQSFKTEQRTKEAKQRKQDVAAVKERARQAAVAAGLRVENPGAFQPAGPGQPEDGR